MRRPAPQASLFGAVEVNIQAPPTTAPRATPVDWDHTDVGLGAVHHVTADQHAAEIRGYVTTGLLLAFLRHGELTIASAAAHVGVKEGTICAPWRNLERRGWVRFAGKHERIEQVSGKPSSRQVHALTAEGVRIAVTLALRERQQIQPAEMYR